MARNSFCNWIVIGSLIGVAACNPAPPYEEVTDPFAPLSPAAPVSSEPLAAPGVISDEVIVSAVDAPGSEGAGGLGVDDASGTANDTVTEVAPSGLVERLPNTCKLENYQKYQGTEGLIAVGLVTDRPARLIEPGDIVSQLYDPQRVNFYTDNGGRVTRISCG